MRNILILFTILTTELLMAQTHMVTKHNGDIMNINIIKTKNNLVYFTLPESSEEKTISQFAISQVNEKSKNEIKTISEKISVVGKSDYSKVKVLQESQTNGLKEAGMITSFLGKTKGDSQQSFLDQAEIRLKQNAALKGSPFIVIVSNKPRELKAKMYTY